MKTTKPENEKARTNYLIRTKRDKLQQDRFDTIIDYLYNILVKVDEITTKKEAVQWIRLTMER